MSGKDWGALDLSGGERRLRVYLEEVFAWLRDVVGMTAERQEHVWQGENSGSDEQSKMVLERAVTVGPSAWCRCGGARSKWWV